MIQTHQEYATCFITSSTTFDDNSNSNSLGAAASRAFDEADYGKALIYIPAIVLAELYFLNEKKDRPLDFRVKYKRIEESRQFVLLPFMPATLLDFEACEGIAEMHDRMIVAEARQHNAILITRDSQITSSGLVPTIW